VPFFLSICATKIRLELPSRKKSYQQFALCVDFQNNKIVKKHDKRLGGIHDGVMLEH
jgi:hypothetical protein